MAQDIMMAPTLEANLFVHQTRTILTGAFNFRLLSIAHWTLPNLHGKLAAVDILEEAMTVGVYPDPKKETVKNEPSIS